MSRSFETTCGLDLSGHRDRLRRELLTLIFETTPIVLAANLVNGTLIALIYFETAHRVIAIGWWGLMMLMVLVRGIAWLRYRRSFRADRFWERVTIAGSSVSGILWGAAGFMFYTSEYETKSMVLGFILAGMGAGAVSSLTPLLPAFYAFLFPSAIPFLLRLLLEGDVDHLGLAAACLLYVISLVLLGRKANRWLQESVYRRFANHELIHSLEQRVGTRTAELEALNDALQADIVKRCQVEDRLSKFAERQATIAKFGQLALSGIELEPLFARAVAVVRHHLDVLEAVVEYVTDEAPSAGIRASPLRAPRSSQPGFGLADHPHPGLSDAEHFVSLEAPAERSTLLSPGADRCATVAISGRDGTLGALIAISEAPRQFTAEDLSFLQSIANMLAAAIERKRAEINLENLALRDPLTGLPNRELFRIHLSQELARTRRTHCKLALLLLDLDHFKDVNDTLGHPVGDRLLALVAERLRSSLREVDAPARLGGDEFAVVVCELRDAEEAAAVARKVVDRICEPFAIDGRSIHIGVSIGLSISPDDADKVDDLLRNADLALYRAKTEGRNTHRFYSVDMTRQVETRKTLEDDLRRALDADQLFLEYQPQVDLGTGRVTGAEALLRWQHPERGLLSPDAFLPVAEASGLIAPLGRWVLMSVAEQYAAWRQAGVPPVSIAANISLSQCRHGSLVETVEALRASNPSGLDWLELEVTEHVFLPTETRDGADILRRLSQLGVTISIDDFGAGYSSLGRLRRLPVDKVKIDKTFVSGLGSDSDAERLVRAIIALAKSLGMTVTAEGIENREQLDFLIAEGCEFGQGFFLARPMPNRAFAALLFRESERPGAAVSIVKA